MLILLVRQNCTNTEDSDHFCKQKQNINKLKTILKIMVENQFLFINTIVSKSAFFLLRVAAVKKQKQSDTP